MNSFYAESLEIWRSEGSSSSPPSSQSAPTITPPMFPSVVQRAARETDADSPPDTCLTCLCCSCGDKWTQTLLCPFLLDGHERFDFSSSFVSFRWPIARRRGRDPVSSARANGGEGCRRQHGEDQTLKGCAESCGDAVSVNQSARASLSRWVTGQRVHVGPLEKWCCSRCQFVSHASAEAERRVGGVLAACSV